MAKRDVSTSGLRWLALALGVFAVVAVLLLQGCATFGGEMKAQERRWSEYNDALAWEITDPNYKWSRAYRDNTGRVLVISICGPDQIFAYCGMAAGCMKSFAFGDVVYVLGGPVQGGKVVYSPSMLGHELGHVWKVTVHSDELGSNPDVWR